MKILKTRIAIIWAFGYHVAGASTPPIAVKGNAFFAGENRFYIRGLDYQPGGEGGLKDPLADAAGCKRDIQKFQQLGINTVRVYTVDNSANHDDCMKQLADAGIYLAVDVNSPKYSLNRQDRETMRRSYSDVYLQSVFATIDTFSKYDNLLAFFAANEVITKTETWSAPYIKALIRDMKAYIAARKYRTIPVGYAATDVEETHYEIATYLNCGPDKVRTDFIGFNDYSWCGPQSFSASTWAGKVKLFNNYSAPMFLSEYGCIKVQPRIFSDVAPLYSSDMTPVYSGGLVYEYSWEGFSKDFPGAGYGVVDINGASVKARPDFAALQSAFNSTPMPSGNGGYKPENKASACPPEGANWQVNASLPVIPQLATKYMTQGAGHAPGLQSNPAGSQYQGSPSSSWAPIEAAGESSALSTPAKSAASVLSPSSVSLIALWVGTFTCILATY
ncbi:1,3-beta-glucanosyltransferase Gel1 [Microthyrium microscopicum]|uniref:1,3-beta-glucanosyltransferase n=1 Tax=Microthyrium microscopicum TaxID=703497 RepID=A0A6A6TXL7_9PEZI|nr:1,3-beta-glucanosyltransferase Gel1 [Microthyrium microscopicum]